MTIKIRLYVDHPLGAGQTVLLNRDQAHYLFGVMRQGLGAQVALFNSCDGEWSAEVSQAGSPKHWADAAAPAELSISRREISISPTGRSWACAA